MDLAATESSLVFDLYLKSLIFGFLASVGLACLIACLKRNAITLSLPVNKEYLSELDDTIARGPNWSRESFKLRMIPAVKRLEQDDLGP